MKQIFTLFMLLATAFAGLAQSVARDLVAYNTPIHINPYSGLSSTGTTVDASAQNSMQTTAAPAAASAALPNGIRQVVVAEYRTWYITNEGKIFGYNNSSQLPVQFNIGGLKADTGAGGFNYFRIIDEQGYIWNSQTDWTTNTNRIDKDTTGAAFNRNKFVDAYGHVALTIRDDGSIWYFGVDAYSLFYTGGKVNSMTGKSMKPTQLSAPGMKFKKALFTYSGILGMTTDGQVYKWSTGQGRTPVKISIPRPAINIYVSHLSVAVCIIPDAGQTSGLGWPYIWGAASTMWGGTGNVTTPTPVRDLWKMKSPIREMSVDWNTIHYIDSLGDLYGGGYNSFGEVGNGQEFINKYNYSNWPKYEWTVTDFENPTGIPQVVGKGIKWKHLYANNWFGFYKYGQDINDNFYSWGRNKSLVLGNGLWGGYDNGAYHSNIMDVLVPTKVTPLTAIFNEYSWAPPSISVGAKQTISTSTATLKGVAKAPLLISIKKPAPNGIDTAGYKIVSYLWTKVSGNGGTITSPNAATTTVTGLSQGTYVFNLFTVDNNTGTMSANDTIVVTSTVPGPPVANAGTDQTITLPVNSVTLKGSGSQVNGSIASYAWTQTSGPATATFGSATQATTTAGNLVKGVYVFRLTVKDAKGTTATDDATITVNAAADNSGGNPTAYLTIPGKIEAESYATITGAATETTTDAGGGKNVGWMDVAGDQVAYNINASAAGTYTVSFRVASPNTGSIFTVQNAAGANLATVTVPNTSGWQVWTTVNAPVTLPAGQQVLKIVCSNTVGWNLNWMQFASPVLVSGKVIPGTVQAEDYDNMSGINTQPTNDVGGGKNVGWIEPGDFMSYNVTVTTAGKYTVGFRVACPYGGAAVTLKNGAGAVLATAAMPNTKDFQVYTTVNATVTLAAGSQTIRIEPGANVQFNINWMQFTYAGAATAGAASGESGGFGADSPTAILDADQTPAQAHFYAYPNPATDNITLDIQNSYTGKLKVQVISISGVIVKTFELNKGFTSVLAPFQVADLAPGLYLVRVEGGGWSETKKILKK